MKKSKTGFSDKKRLLISINVLGSCGAIRLVVNEDENAGSVIDAALKLYARQGRLPILPSDQHAFSLYPAFVQYHHALKSWEAIGCGGARNFVLCKTEDNKREDVRINDRKGSGWRAWLHKSLSLKILTH